MVGEAVELIATTDGTDPEAVELVDTRLTFICVAPVTAPATPVTAAVPPGLTLTDMTSELLCFLDGCEADGGP